MTIPVTSMTGAQARAIALLSRPDETVTIDPQVASDPGGWLRVTVGPKPYVLDDGGNVVQGR